jgi:hypothetical protein
MRSLGQKARARRFEKRPLEPAIGDEVTTRWGVGEVVAVEGDLCTVDVDGEDREMVVSALERSGDLVGDGGQRG